MSELPQPLASLQPSAVRSALMKRRRWALPVALGMLVPAVLLSFVRIQIHPRARRDVVDPRIAWLGTQAMNGVSVLSEQIDLLDDAPLFLPTERNYSVHRTRSDGARSPGELFSYYAPRLEIPLEASPPGLVGLPEAVEDAFSVVQGFQRDETAAFGRVDRVPLRAVLRFAGIQVRSIADGELVLSYDIPVTAAPAIAASWGDWLPFEMLVGIGESGSLGRPLIVERGSGIEGVDAFFRDYLGRDFRLDLRVPAGQYRVVVGP